MKMPFKLVSRFAAATFTAGVLCVGSVAFAQEGSYAPDKADPPSVDQKKTAPAAAAAEDTAPKPGKVGSMAPVGLKPSKAELAKQKEAAGSNPSATTQMAGAAMADTDRQFIQMAGKDGMKEVHMGQMAVQQGQSDEVKKLGSKIVTDHTKANNQLMAIAEKKGMKLDLRHKMDKMSKKDMENFDQAWLAMMVNDHNKDIAAYDKQAKMGADPELKAYAKKTLPVLQSHLKMVKAAQSKMMAKKTS